MKKRILPALLALCMVMSLLPAAAFAESEEVCACGCTYGAYENCCTAPVDDPAANNVEPKNGTCGCETSSVKCGNTSCTICYPGGDGDNPPAVKRTCQCTDTGCTHTNAASSAPCGAEVTGSGDLCEACDAYARTKCTGTEGCGSMSHKANCLSLCTMGMDCPNTPGDASAHRVRYGVSEGGSPVTVHCPMAGVADDVVLGGGNGGAAKPDEPAEPDAPAKNPGAPAKAEDFSDVPAGSWYADDLTTLMEKGIFVGQGEKFDPQSNTTGAQVVVLLSRVLGKELVTTGSAWSLQATTWAAREGITEGITISTTGELSRKDLILMLWRAAGKPESTQSLAAFSDVDGLEGDYLAALRWAVERGIVKGNGDGTINPGGATKRCEMAALLVRYDGAVNQ